MGIETHLYTSGSKSLPIYPAPHLRRVVAMPLTISPMTIPMPRRSAMVAITTTDRITTLMRYMPLGPVVWTGAEVECVRLGLLRKTYSRKGNEPYHRQPKNVPHQSDPSPSGR